MTKFLDSCRDKKKIDFIKQDWINEFNEIKKDGNSNQKNNSLNKRKFKIKIKY